MPSEPSFVALGEDDFLREARAIVDAAQARGTALRILGSLGIYAHSMHVPECISVYHRVGRISEGTPLFTDLDLMGYASQGRSISRVFDDLGFRPDDVINGFFGDRRLVYYDGKNLNGLDLTAVRRQFGIVLQSARISAGSIFDNIACGNMIRLEECWQAIRDAGLEPARPLVGSYITSLEMAGASLTVLELDDELTTLWDAPVRTAALRWGV